MYFVKISLLRRRTVMVEDGAFSHEEDYVAIFLEIQNLKWHQNCITGLRVTALFAEWVDFAHWWSFSGGGSVINGAYHVLFLDRFMSCLIFI